MTKADIVERLKSEFGVNTREASDMLETVLDLMKKTLETGENIKINGFGKFEVKQKKDRKGRNPQTGDVITIEARRVLAFRPSPILRERINQECLNP